MKHPERTGWIEPRRQSTKIWDVKKGTDNNLLCNKRTKHSRYQGIKGVMHRFWKGNGHYLSRKKNSNGHNFSFLGFVGVADASSLERRLNGVEYGGRNLKNGVDGEGRCPIWKTIMVEISGIPLNTWMTRISKKNIVKRYGEVLTEEDRIWNRCDMAFRKVDVLNSLRIKINEEIPLFINGKAWNQHFGGGGVPTEKLRSILSIFSSDRSLSEFMLNPAGLEGSPARNLGESNRPIASGNQTSLRTKRRPMDGHMTCGMHQTIIVPWEFR
ncbi:hypothetical protein L1887_36068 [Cichorium endivia]|nr:hypothetical protein L1887_36068 [Cichorium endivia]